MPTLPEMAGSSPAMTETHQPPMTAAHTYRCPHMCQWLGRLVLYAEAYVPDRTVAGHGDAFASPPRPNCLFRCAIMARTRSGRRSGVMPAVGGEAARTLNRKSIEAAARSDPPRIPLQQCRLQRDLRVQHLRYRAVRL